MERSETQIAARSDPEGNDGRKVHGFATTGRVGCINYRGFEQRVRRLPSAKAAGVAARREPSRVRVSAIRQPAQLIGVRPCILREQT